MTIRTYSKGELTHADPLCYRLSVEYNEDDKLEEYYSFDTPIDEALSDFFGKVRELAQTYRTDIKWRTVKMATLNEYWYLHRYFAEMLGRVKE